MSPLSDLRLYSYANQDCVAGAGRHRPTEQVHSTDFWQTHTSNSGKERESFQTVLESFYIHRQESKPQPNLHIWNKN